MSFEAFLKSYRLQKYKEFQRKNEEDKKEEEKKSSLLPQLNRLRIPKSQYLRVRSDQRTVSYHGRGLYNSDIATTQAVLPCRSNSPLYYFEVKIINPGSKKQANAHSRSFLIGLAEKDFDPQKLIGNTQHSYGLKADGKLFHNKISTAGNIGANGTGSASIRKDDIVGVGVLFTKRQVFFTYNGYLLEHRYSNLDLSIELYPSVSLHDNREEVEFNFGVNSEPGTNPSEKSEFEFDVGNFINNTFYEQYQEVQKMNIKVTDIHAMMRGYLKFYGYEKTLQKFKKESGFEWQIEEELARSAKEAASMMDGENSSPGKRRTTHHSSFKPNRKDETAEGKMEKQISEAVQIMGVQGSAEMSQDKQEEEMKLPDTSLLDISQVESEVKPSQGEISGFLEMPEPSQLAKESFASDVGNIEGETEFSRVMRRLSSVDYGRYSFDESAVPLVRFESMPSKLLLTPSNQNYPFLEMRAHLRQLAMEERFQEIIVELDKSFPHIFVKDKRLLALILGHSFIRIIKQNKLQEAIEFGKRHLSQIKNETIAVRNEEGYDTEVSIIDVFGLICYANPNNFWVNVPQGDLVAQKVSLAIIQYQLNTDKPIEPALVTAFKHIKQLGSEVVALNCMQGPHFDINS